MSEKKEDKNNETAKKIFFILGCLSILSGLVSLPFILKFIQTMPIPLGITSSLGTALTLISGFGLIKLKKWAPLLLVISLIYSICITVIYFIPDFSFEYKPSLSLFDFFGWIIEIIVIWYAFKKKEVFCN